MVEAWSCMGGIFNFDFSHLHTCCYYCRFDYVVRYCIIMFFFKSCPPTCFHHLFCANAYCLITLSYNHYGWAWSCTLGGIFDFVVIVELQSFSISFKPLTCIVSHSCCCFAFVTIVLGFVVFVTIVLGFVVLMASFVMLHNISSTDEVFPTSVGYDSN
jgi:hypothetical protein